MRGSAPLLAFDLVFFAMTGFGLIPPGVCVRGRYALCAFPRMVYAYSGLSVLPDEDFVLVLVFHYEVLLLTELCVSCSFVFKVLIGLFSFVHKAPMGVGLCLLFDYVCASPPSLHPNGWLVCVVEFLKIALWP